MRDYYNARYALHGQADDSAIMLEANGDNPQESALRFE
jgi:hypothetical protein